MISKNIHIESSRKPFKYLIIDNFLEKKLAKQLSSEFIHYDNDLWYSYDNPLENKKALNNYNCFPETTYKFFNFLNSDKFLTYLQNLTGIEKLFGDPGLHGAGWHIHKAGGKLNIHLDYDLHPKLKLQRKLNFILYLTENWNPAWGGNLEFWSHNKKTNAPDQLKATIENKFNRAVIFDTSKNSWHGFPQPITCPKNIYRKSIASYYLVKSKKVTKRMRAQYALSEDQKDDQSIIEFAKQRSSL